MPVTAPALVLGVETQIGLALVRELGRAGVRVIAMSHEAHAIGLASRHVWRRELVPAPRSDAVIDSINRLARELGPLSLLAVSEVNLQWLNGARARLHPDVHPAVPSADALAAVLDKSRTLAAARAVGIDVPVTVEPRSMAEVEVLATALSYPVVLKWKDVNAIALRLGQAGLEVVKAEYVRSAAALLDACRRYEPVGAWPLIQEYCAGHGLGQFFFIHEGRVVRRFQHRRVAEWPPEGGFSSVCDALPLTEHVALFERSAALLAALGWQGVAMVEYRHDLASGRSRLMEINGRFWGSLPLAVACGAGFALLSHHAALGEALPQLPEPRSDLRCRMLATEVKRLRRLWLHRGQILDPLFEPKPLADTLRFVADFLRPSVRYFVWDLDDPKPTWRDLRNSLLHDKG